MLCSKLHSGKVGGGERLLSGEGGREDGKHKLSGTKAALISTTEAATSKHFSCLSWETFSIRKNNIRCFLLGKSVLGEASLITGQLKSLGPYGHKVIFS